MTNPVDYNTERENNIIKNIAKEIVIECFQNGVEAPQELAQYLVKLKLLNPKNGFTASEVMPRSLTQQLVASILEDLKQDTPAMNCIKLQVFWNSVNLNLEDLKKEFCGLMAEKAEPYLTELLALEREDAGKVAKVAASYILTFQNLGSPTNSTASKETIAAIHSVFKTRDTAHYFSYGEEEKVENIKRLSRKITGIRLYLKMTGRGNEGIEDVKNLLGDIETCKEDNQMYMEAMSQRIQNIREVIFNVLSMDFFAFEIDAPAEVNLPPECDPSDLKYLKQILVIMLQHSFYLSDLSSKLDEIDGNVNFFLKELDEILQRIQTTVRDREAVPTTEVYEDFIRAGELWFELQSYSYCLDVVKDTTAKLEEFNKKEHFNPTTLEKNVTIFQRVPVEELKKSEESKISLPPGLLLTDSEDFQLEFRGFCAWTLFYGEGFIVPGSLQGGIFQYNDQYYSFSNKNGHELWGKDPQYYLMHIYELLRHNTEMIELLNAYDNLYSVRSLHLIKKVERRISTRAEEVQTVVHPIEKLWDKDYTFSEWELKKRALALSRLVKCVTKSVQTVNHSHYRSSIGLLAAPDKEKEVQTRKESSCMHETIANYLFGLRGHREDKFKVIELTRPVEETCEREIILEKGDPCRDRRQVTPWKWFPYTDSPCPPWEAPMDGCKYSSESSYEYNGEG